VLVDDFCQTLAVETHPGPATTLSRSEALTLALYARCGRFRSDRDFYRWVERYLRREFPCLPHRTQWVRQVLHERETLERFAIVLAQELASPGARYEALDRASAPIRNRKRRGRSWLAGIADIGLSREGWFFGFSVLVCVQPTGVVTGWGFGPASAKDQPLAEVLFAARHALGGGGTPFNRDPAHPSAGRLTLPSAGVPAVRHYLADKGFQGIHLHARWRQQYGIQVWAPPQDDRSQEPWPREQRRALAAKRQIVESVIAKITDQFRLIAERPHTLAGFACRLAVRMALHNCCIWINRQRQRPDLSFAEMLSCC
jgi:hypothetical protein